MFSPGAILREKLEKRGVSQIFFEIGALAQIFRINFRHRQTVPAKMPGKFEESDILFAHVVQNADRAVVLAGQPDDLPPRAAQLALQRLHLRRPGEWKCCSKSFLRTSMNGFPAISAFDGAQPGRLSPHKDNIEPATAKTATARYQSPIRTSVPGLQPLYSVYGFNGRDLA